MEDTVQLEAFFHFQFFSILHKKQSLRFSKMQSSGGKKGKLVEGKNKVSDLGCCIPDAVGHGGEPQLEECAPGVC